MKLSILMPVYNEITTIDEILKQVIAVDVEKEIIIVDDGSTDGTRDYLDKQAREMPGVQVHLHERNQGKGAAIRTAQQYISGEITLIQDADLEYDPRDYPVLMEPIIEGKADVVYGSRFLGKHRAFLFWHRLANYLLTLMTNILYDTILTDMETCYKAFRSDIFKKVEIKSDRFDFEPEITAKIFKQKCRVFEVPIYYAGRDYKEGKKIGLKDAFEAIWALVKFRFTD